MLKEHSKVTLNPVHLAVIAALYPSYQAVAQEDFTLEEIVVTATKRSLSIQDIASTVQAIPEATLKQMGAKSMEDFARFMPGVNVVSGVTSSTVVFRGAITGAGYIASSTGSVYLDELPLTQVGSQPNVRLVDIERVEALSGPQGTLYGSDAQAGTMRIITNKPVIGEQSTVFDGEYRYNSEGDPSFRGSVVFNVPIEDNIALRVSLFNDKDGGYIDNVYGHTADQSFGEPWPQAGVAGGHGSLDNAESVANDVNFVRVKGGRAALKWEIDDSWTTTISTMHQETSQGSGNYFDIYRGDLNIVSFHDDWYKEDWQASSVLIEGDLGFAQLVAAVSYHEREGRGVWDITNYAHYWSHNYCFDSYYTQYYAPYYYANPDTGYISWYPVYCQGTGIDSDFYSSYQGRSGNDKLSAEVRLSSQGDRFDWLVGMYYEDAEDWWTAPFAVPTNGGKVKWGESTFQNSFAAAAYRFSGIDYPTATSHWYSESATEWDQKAVFGELTWHATDKIDVNIGARSFDRTNTQWYIVNHPGGDGVAGYPDPAVAEVQEYRLAQQALGKIGLETTRGRTGNDKEFIPKISVKYNLNDESMIYGLFTKGYRPGGVNRSRGDPFFPNAYGPDIMENREFGYKSSFADGRGRLNIIGYDMEWSEYQLEQVDPSQVPCDANGNATDFGGPDVAPSVKTPGVCGQPWQNLVANTGEATIKGLNLEMDYRVNERLSLGFNMEWKEAETGADPTGIVEAGLQLPLSADTKGAFWMDYTWEASQWGSNYGFMRFQYSKQGAIWNNLDGGNPASSMNPRQRVPGYAIADARIGLQGDDWEVSVFVNNLLDERAAYTYSGGQFLWGMGSSADGVDHHQLVYTNRPREIGIRYTQSW
jgi:outer membrane receptor protein involved in Fe transport